MLAEARRALREGVTLHPVAVGSVVLAGAYFWFLLTRQALPGQDGLHPLGWWGWFDQGRTLESLRAFAAFDLSAARHWYPVGYSLLGVPFPSMGFRAHPFVVVDLVCLLATFWAFVAVAGACGVRRAWACLVFVLAVTWDSQIFSEWVIPWNSTPAAALVWAVLAVCARWLAGVRHPVLLGALAGAVPLFRPTEAPAVALCVAWVLVADWRAGVLGRRTLLGVAAGGALLVGAGVGLHLAIHGPRASEYMLLSRRLGFSVRDLGWKAYVLLADPYWWFWDGPGLLRRAPWVALGFAGMVAALVRGRASGMLAAALTVHLLLYVSYVDLLPTGLWRFNNVHYFKWAVPGYALLAWLLVRDMVPWRWRLPSFVAAGAVVAMAGVSLVRVAPRAAGADEAAKMLEYRGDAPGFDASYFGAFRLRDGRGVLANISDVRAFPVPGGMRVIGLSRRIEGDVVFEPGHGLPDGLVAGVPERFVPALVLGRPCWVPGSLCGARVVNGLLPPLPSR